MAPRLFALATAVLAAAASGCVEQTSIPTTKESAEPEVKEKGDILVALLVPNSLQQELRFNISIVAPVEQVKTGYLLKHHPETTHCTVPAGIRPQVVCESDGTVLAYGDLENADASEYSPYPFASFVDVEYNGTWTLHITKVFDQLVGGDVHHQGPMGVPSCVEPRFSSPNGRLILGEDHYWGAPGCYVDAVLEFDWASKTWREQANVTV